LGGGKKGAPSSGQFAAFWCLCALQLIEGASQDVGREEKRVFLPFLQMEERAKTGLELEVNGEKSGP